MLTFLQGLSKIYTTDARFGITTDTQDATGTPSEPREVSFTTEQLEEAMASLTGEISQIPPMVSAVRIDGVRLYELARKGIEVERPPRSVRVFSFETLSLNGDQASFRINCSSGTYIRTLIADLGEMLGCGAHVIALRRTSIGAFSEEDAITLDELEAMDPAGRLDKLLPMAEAMRDFPLVQLTEAEVKAVSHGVSLEGVGSREGELPMARVPRSGQSPDHHPGMVAGVPVGLVDTEGNLIAVYRRTSRGLKAEAVLV